jgi:hypothetical protein
MIKKIALATALVLSMASTAAMAAGDRDSLHDRQNAAACERAVAPNICK